MDWITKYLSKPWINGQQDCWQLVRDVYREQLNIELPQIVVNAEKLREVITAMESTTNLSDWQPIEQPGHWSLVFWSQLTRPSHVGIYLDIDGGRILHNTQRTGVVCQSVHDMSLQGWCNPRYYRHKKLNAESLKLEA